MAAGVDVLKSYLVSLGFGVDAPSYDKFQRTLDEATGKVAQHTTSMTKSYVIAAGAIASALASVGFFTVGLLNKVADADLEYQLFAQHMFMGKEAAKQMKIATDALGESLDDISWNPELRKRYYELLRLEQRMEQPADAQDQFKKIRDIKFEFTRLKVEATYAMQWIGYQLTKHLAGPIKDITQGMRRLNEFIVSKMPEWSDKFARVLVTIINLGKSAWRMITNIFGGLKEVWDMLPGWGKALAVAVAIAFAPISPAIKAIGLLLTALDDFYAYIDGRKSSKMLAPVWHALIQATDTIVRGLVSAMVLIDGIFSNKSWSDVWKDTKKAWATIEGTTGVEKKPYEGKYRIENLMGGEEESKPSPTAKKMKQGVDNYQSLAYNSASSSVVNNQAGASNVKIEVGDVNVTVAKTDANPREIAGAVQQGVRDMMKDVLARNTREASGSL